MVSRGTVKGYATLPNCVTCGRFCTQEPGASWRMVYSGGPIPMPDHEQIQCRSCTERYGPLQGQAGIRPEYAAGVYVSSGDERNG